MLDIKFIRDHPNIVREGIKKKGGNPEIVDRLLELDKKKRLSIRSTESLAAEQKKLGKENIEEAQEIKAQIKKIEPELVEAKKEIHDLMRQIPNLPFDDVPVGKDEGGNVVLKEVGKKPKFSFKPKDYLEIAERLDMVDVKRASKVSGTRFGYLKREAVLLEFALINLAFDTLIKKNFIPVIPPVMLKKEMAKGTGYFEAVDEKEAYFLSDDNLYLVGTSEQSLLAMHSDEIFEEKDLPKKYLGFSTCFRREAGAYGKDTKGILRVHQFDKIEMITFSKLEDSRKEHKFFLETEEKLMQLLKIPYRVVQICSGDLGMPAASKYDIEAWMPGQNKYRETHSTSNCTDFQARRLNIRYHSKNGLKFVHTLNGTAFAIGRMIITIIENYQQKDGSVAVPKVLQKYVGFKTIKNKG